MSSTHVIPRNYHSQQHVSQYNLDVPAERKACLSFTFLIFWELHCSGLLRGELWNSLPAFRDNLPVPSLRVKNPEESLALSRNVGKELRLAATPSSTVKYPEWFLSCPETSIRNYHHFLRNNSEECNSHLIGGSLKSRFVFIILLIPLIHIRVNGTYNLVVNFCSVILFSAQEIITLQACFGHSHVWKIFNEFLKG